MAANRNRHLRRAPGCCGKVIQSGDAANPMNILFVIISTVPFGSNDLLAYKAAEELLRLGHQVLVSPWDWGNRNAL